MKIISRSLEETQAAARNFLKEISERKSDKAIVVGLFGDLGAGKTTFTQALARELGIAEFVTSPTFVIMKAYPISQSTIYNLQSTIYKSCSHRRLPSGQRSRISRPEFQ